MFSNLVLFYMHGLIIQDMTIQHHGALFRAVKIDQSKVSDLVQFKILNGQFKVGKI